MNLVRVRELFRQKTDDFVCLSNNGVDDRIPGARPISQLWCSGAGSSRQGKWRATKLGKAKRALLSLPSFLRCLPGPDRFAPRIDFPPVNLFQGRVALILGS